MGNKPPKEADEAKAKAQTIRDLLKFSKADPRARVDAVTLDGIIRYLSRALAQSDDWQSMDILQRTHSYQQTEQLVRKIGMSTERQSKLLAELYSLLNQDRRMSDAGIPSPGDSDSESSDSDSDSDRDHGSTSGGDAPAHPAFLLQELDTLLADTHSYLALAGWTKQRLIRFDTKALMAAMQADRDFIDKSFDYTPPAPVNLTNFIPAVTSASTSGATPASTASIQIINYWTLPESEKASAVSKIVDEYAPSLANRTGVAPTTNAQAIAVFMANKEVAMRAVRAGYDFFEPTEGASQLFGRTAIAVEFALGVASTLAGRGASSITESSMQESPDGHNNRGLDL